MRLVNTLFLHRGCYTVVRRYKFYVMFFLLFTCRHTDDDVFGDFPKISDHF